MVGKRHMLRLPELERMADTHSARHGRSNEVNHRRSAGIGRASRNKGASHARLTRVPFRLARLGPCSCMGPCGSLLGSGMVRERNQGTSPGSCGGPPHKVSRAAGRWRCTTRIQTNSRGGKFQPGRVRSCNRDERAFCHIGASHRRVSCHVRIATASAEYAVLQSVRQHRRRYSGNREGLGRPWASVRERVHASQRHPGAPRRLPAGVAADLVTWR